MRQAIQTFSSKDDARVSAAGLIDYMRISTRSEVLLSLFGWNNGAAAWIQFFDTALGTPLAGAVPMHTFGIAAADNYSVIVPLTGINFGNGVFVAVSSTGPLYTAAGSKDVTMLATLIA